MKTFRRHRHAGGFSLIEVLIALVVLAFGLLGLALLQTVNLKYTQSANQRTQAVNLAGQLLDAMRSNRSEIPAYYGDGNVAALGATCDSMPDVLGAAANLAAWRCKVRKTLGQDATYVIEASPTDPARTDVEVRWTENNASAILNQGKIRLSTEI